LAALTELCEKNKIEIGTSPTRYFPIRNQEDGTWKHRIKALKNKSRMERDVIAAASTDYMTHMYNLYQESQAEYYRQRQRIADAKMARSGMKFQLEKSRKAAWEREEEVRKREHDMESAMREQSRKIDQIEAELKHAQEINDVSQITSAIYRDTV